MEKRDDGRIRFGVAQSNGSFIGSPNSRMSTIGKDAWLAEFELKHSVVMSSKKHINEQHLYTKDKEAI